ncbi:MAG: methyltransferase domain-containing protein [Bacteroidota bacterium]
MAWNPDTYNKFKAERYAPFYDLLSLIKVRPGLSVIDMGCGTGELTRLLADHLPGSIVSGIDSSPEMLEEAASFSNTQVTFFCKTIQEQIGDGTKWDLVFSHAALQWVDNHRQLLKDIISIISEGGQLAVQVPSNHDHFTHVFLHELALQNPYKEALEGWVRKIPVLTITEYADIFFEGGGKDITVFEKVYPHILKDANSLYDWVSGTAMLRYMDRLPDEFKDSFKKDYKKKLIDEFKNTPVFYPFKRIIMTATF